MGGKRWCSVYTYFSITGDTLEPKLALKLLLWRSQLLAIGRAQLKPAALQKSSSIPFFWDWWSSFYRCENAIGWSAQVCHPAKTKQHAFPLLPQSVGQPS